MGWPRVQFVSAPDDSAAVRLDLNAAGIDWADIEALHDGWSFGAPSLSGEPGTRGRTWGTRTTSLPLQVQGSKSAALAALSNVAREIARAENWLRFQLSPDVRPVWLRTYATAPGPLDPVAVYNDRTSDLWRVDLPVAADPFAVGEEVTLPALSITNTPAGMTAELPPISGDVPAPARVRVDKGAGGMLGPAVAVAHTVPGVVASPSWGAGVGSAVTNAGYIAGSYRATGALSDWATLATWSPGALPAGRRRLLVRLGGSSGVGSVQLRWVVAAAGVSSRVTSRAVTVPVFDQVRWVDVGEVPYPLVDDLGLGALAETTLRLEGKRLVPGGDLRLDAPLLMLSDASEDDLLMLSPDDVGLGAVSLLVDASVRRAAMAVGGAPMRAPGAVGGWPFVHPGRDNHLTVLQNLDPTRVDSRHDSAVSSVSVSVSYRPQYMWGW